MLLHQFSGGGCQIVWDLTNISVEFMLPEKSVMRKRNTPKLNLWALWFQVRIPEPSPSLLEPEKNVYEC